MSGNNTAGNSNSSQSSCGKSLAEQAQDEQLKKVLLSQLDEYLTRGLQGATGSIS